MSSSIRCALRREGDDITLVSWGASMTEALAAADALALEGVGATVVDVRPAALADGLLDAVRWTGRCVIVHEGARRAGFGAEIAAEVAEHAATTLLAPVQRVTGYDVVTPLPRLERAYLPGTDRVLPRPAGGADLRLTRANLARASSGSRIRPWSSPSGPRSDRRRRRLPPSRLEAGRPDEALGDRLRNIVVGGVERTTGGSRFALAASWSTRESRTP